GDLRGGGKAEPEDGAETADAAGGGRAIETAIHAFHQRGCRMRAGIEAVQCDQHRERAGGRDAEDGAVAGRRADANARGFAICRAVEIAITALDESRTRIRTV